MIQERTAPIVTSPDQNNSKWLVVTWVTYVWGFTMIPAMYVNNDVKYELDFRVKMRKYILALLKRMNGAALSKIELERNRVFTAELTAEYAALGNAFQVPYAKREDLYNQISGIMGAANFPGEYDVVANAMHKPLVDKLASNGRTNADNTEFQLLGFEHHYTNDMVQNAGVRDTLYVIPENTLYLVNRNAPDAIAGTSLMGGGQVWGEEYLEEIGLTVGTYYNEQCTDATQIFATPETRGLQRAAMQGFSFDTDVAYVTAYNSNPATRVGPINKFEVATAPQ